MSQKSTKQALSKRLETLAISKDGLTIIKLRNHARTLSEARSAFGLSQREMAELLALYTGTVRTRQAVALYEWWDRNRRNAKYRPPAQVVEAYKQILLDAVQLLDERVAASISGKYTWSLSLVANCAQCGRRFRIERHPNEVNCKRCRR